MTKNLSAIFFAFAWLVTSCTVGDVPLATAVPPTVAPTIASATNTPLPAPTNTAAPAPASTAALAATPAPAQPTPTHVAVDLTPAQRAAIQAVSSEYNIPADQIHLLKTEAMTWPTGCLGIVLPGVMCTKGPVDGFRMTLEANGQQYEFHTNQDGTSAIDAAQQLATIQLVVLASGGSVQLTSPNIGLGPTYNPAFTGFLPYGGAVGGTAYVLDFSQKSQAQAIDINGTRGLDFIQNPNYGLALWHGGPNVQPRLAWGTQLTSGAPSSLLMSATDGSQLETLLTLDAGANPPVQLVAEAWSADGQTLYFSKEPVGIGGYILFAGASNLYKIDITSKQVTELIPLAANGGPMICLDALSQDFRFVADHCTSNVITIRNLTDSSSTTIQPPVGIAGFRIMGSARFSPDGSRVAFALGKGDPNAEQGWLAVGDRAGGASNLIFTTPAGVYDTVLGWLDDQTLLVQSSSLLCNPTCLNQLWTVGIDGSAPVKVTDGSFLTIIDNR